MFFNITLALSVVIFGAGVIWRAGSWLKKDPAQVPPSSGRLKTAAAAVFRAVFSRRILAVLKSFAMDVLLQKTSLRQSPFRWVMHMLIWVGFVLLVVFHALDAVTSKNLFPGYYPTVNPYWMLRDILGGLVLLGVLMAAGRRLQPGNPRLKSTSKDWIALILLAVIMLSGFALAGMKITSKQAFDRMERDYSLITEKKESKQLEAFWAAEYGLEASPMDRPLDPEQVEAGAELNRLYCADCHSRPQTAPVSYVTAALIGPVAGPLDRINFASFLWHVHFLFVFAGLAYLPFGKFFHILATPAYLLARAGMGRADDPTGSSVMRAMALDACMHCGACSEICAVGSVHAVIPNDLILPSEKIALLQRLARGQPLRGEDLPEAVEGMLLCTNCSRCGDVCPAGIDLQKLWDAVREGLLAKGAADHPD
ncbi:MAG: 4Fe-4S dicluster domain-containing protein, partial [Desulfonatronovibrionaceae bacterium]